MTRISAREAIRPFIFQLPATSFACCVHGALRIDFPVAAQSPAPKCRPDRWNVAYSCGEPVSVSPRNALASRSSSGYPGPGPAASLRESRPMIGGIRKFARSKWAIVLLFIPLIVSFGIFGFNDPFSGVMGGGFVQVGDHQVRQLDVSRAVDGELNRIREESGEILTPRDAARRGLTQQILGQRDSARIPARLCRQDRRESQRDSGEQPVEGRTAIQRCAWPDQHGGSGPVCRAAGDDPRGVPE